MNVEELRRAFNLSETIVERVRRFNLERTARLRDNETPVPFTDGAKIVLQLIPILSFDVAQRYDIDRIASHSEKMSPIYTASWNHRYNLDGFVTFDADEGGNSYSYVQLYRNGIMEAVNASLLKPWHDQTTYIPNIMYEQELIKSLRVYLSLLQGISVELPIFIFMDLIGVKGYIMAVDRSRFALHGYAIDRDSLLLPEVIVEKYDVKAENILKPCFDSIWNACGFSRSMNYNDKEEWSPPR
ncbi:MAG: hypothetical protein HY667_06360 [Chloroflexi bacterium]|nr:hypothetical protein [Chloroflexota bacterium]